MGIIIKPLVTEKMTAITDKLNRFGFVVRPEANKLEIKKEIEALYNLSLIHIYGEVTMGKIKRGNREIIVTSKTTAGLDGLRASKMCIRDRHTSLYSHQLQ